MFKPPKKSGDKPIKPLQALSPIHTASHLLKDNKRLSLIKRIKEHAMLDHARFDSIGDSLIKQLAEYCQLLPETMTSYYALPGGLIDHALNRCDAALELLQAQLVLNDQNQASEEQLLWIYALMSASLLKGIGRLAIEYQVNLYDNKGVLLNPWNPIIHSMQAVGSHYEYQQKPELADAYRSRLNIILAHNIMPISGFNWLASNPQVFANWLALLNEDVASAGTLGAILEYADALAIQRYFNDIHLKNLNLANGRGGRIGTFIDRRPENLENKDQEIGIQFIQWLNKSLEQAELVINKAPLLLVPGGLLLSSELFKLFIKAHPEYTNWQLIQKGFLSLGLHQRFARGEHQAQFEQHNKDKVEGIVFSNYAVALPTKVQVVNLQGQTNAMTSLELICMGLYGENFARSLAQGQIFSLMRLNSQGLWLKQNQKPTTQPGMAFSG